MTQAARLAWPGVTLPTPADAKVYLDAARAPLLAGRSYAPRTAAVAGGSPQALGFAVALARTGVAVTLIEGDQHDAQRVSDTLSQAKTQAGISIVVDVSMITNVDVLIEASGAAAPQRLAILTALRKIAAADAVLISLGYDPQFLDDAAQFEDAGRLVLIDTAAPPPHIDLVEIIAASATTEAALTRVEGLARHLGALPLRTSAFLGGSLLAGFEDCAEDLVFRGSTPWEVDAAVEAFGFDLGPCAAQDLRGLDIAYARHRREDASKARRFATPVLDRMVPEGRLGRKGGVGWYRYPGGGGRVIDPLIEDLAREEAYFAGATTLPIPDDTLRQHLVLALINDAASLYAKGIPAPVIDLAATAATGFPPTLGGPLFFAQHIGFRTIAKTLTDLAAVEGRHWAPTDGLLALATRNRLV